MRTLPCHLQHSSIISCTIRRSRRVFHDADLPSGLAIGARSGLLSSARKNSKSHEGKPQKLTLHRSWISAVLPQNFPDFGAFRPVHRDRLGKKGNNSPLFPRRIPSAKKKWLLYPAANIFVPISFASHDALPRARRRCKNSKKMLVASENGTLPERDKNAPVQTLRHDDLTVICTGVFDTLYCDHYTTCEHPISSTVPHYTVDEFWFPTSDHVILRTVPTALNAHATSTDGFTGNKRHRGNR